MSTADLSSRLGYNFDVNDLEDHFRTVLNHLEDAINNYSDEMERNSWAAIRAFSFS